MGRVVSIFLVLLEEPGPHFLTNAYAIAHLTGMDWGVLGVLRGKYFNQEDAVALRAIS